MPWILYENLDVLFKLFFAEVNWAIGNTISAILYQLERETAFKGKSESTAINCN